MNGATVTVWSLELDDPAAIRPPSHAPRTALRVARAEEPGTSERFYRAVGAHWQWHDRLGWNRARWAEWEARVETHVAWVGDQEAGYVEIDGGERRTGSVELAYFGLLPGFEGRGLGGHLLTWALYRALTLAPRVWVHTCSLDGPHALANYQARGLRLFRTEEVLWPAAPAPAAGATALPGSP